MIRLVASTGTTYIYDGQHPDGIEEAVARGAIIPAKTYETHEADMRPVSLNGRHVVAIMRPRLGA